MPFKTAFLMTLRRVGWFLAIWFILSQLFDQWLLRLTHEAMMADSGVQARVFGLAAISVLSSILVPLVATLTVLAGWHQVAYETTTHTEDRSTTVAFVQKHWEDLIREQLRAMGSIMMWSFLLIIPGLIRFFELCFLPWVVCFDSQYQKGERDALKESRRVFYLVWPKLTALLILFWIVVPLFLTTLDRFRSYFESPGTAIGLSLVDAVLFILFQWLLFRLWEKAHGTELQVARH